MLSWLPSWLFDPLHGDGYQFWSGIGSGSPILAAAVIFLHRHNCHEFHCIRPAWHPHPATGHPVCKRHHPDHPSG
jgi:hypothetical protein